ncbi:MAG: hypothetical protein H6838_15915 [Planctomycetes bacterium]|nr:hypothetical protein [Planctomycetota bacterium]
MTDSTAPATDPVDTSSVIDSWEQLLENLRQRYPGQKDSVLFCINKLHQNPELTLRDFRDEARLYGINLAGRSLHSAKVLLGLAEPSARRKPEPAVAAAPVTLPPKAARTSPTKAAATIDDSIEGQLLDVVQRLQSSAGAEAERLRSAIRAALDVIEDVLAED